MIYFLSDYSQGALPEVMDALMKTNMEHTNGYCLDDHCQRATEIIKGLIGRKSCDVHYFVGGTPANVTTLTAALRPYEAVVAPKTGHIYSHETGGIEARGHRIIATSDENGKITSEMVDAAWDEFEDEHTIIPKAVYISNATENGSVYTKAELQALRECCNRRDMYLYMDGARLAAALTSEANDLTLEDIANLTDAFYIGGTKNGALMGEALVILNEKLNTNFRWMMKQNFGLLAKGRLLGVQFETLLDGGHDSLYFKAARHANQCAKVLRDGLAKLGCEFYGQSATNQVFPIFKTSVVEELEKEFVFYRWAPEREGKTPVRFVTSWGTKMEDVEALLLAVAKLI